MIPTFWLLLSGKTPGRWATCLSRRAEFDLRSPNPKPEMKRETLKPPTFNKKQYINECETRNAPQRLKRTIRVPCEGI